MPQGRFELSPFDIDQERATIDLPRRLQAEARMSLAFDQCWIQPDLDRETNGPVRPGSASPPRYREVLILMGLRQQRLKTVGESMTGAIPRSRQERPEPRRPRAETNPTVDERALQRDQRGDFRRSQLLTSRCLCHCERNWECGNLDRCFLTSTVAGTTVDRDPLARVEVAG